MQLTDTNGINSLYPVEKLPDHRNINFCVAQPTKPSNYFHILRRQMLRNYRKPLVIITPKIGLRSPLYVSKFEEFGENYKFKPIIVDDYVKDNEKVQKVIFCSGQIFMEINKQTENLIKQSKANHILIRIEEIAPFPEQEIMNQLNNLNKEAKVIKINKNNFIIFSSFGLKKNL